MVRAELEPGDVDTPLGQGGEQPDRQTAFLPCPEDGALSTRRGTTVIIDSSRAAAGTRRTTEGVESVGVTIPAPTDRGAATADRQCPDRPARSRWRGAGHTGSLGAVYRFLLSPRWLGALALTLVAAAVMVFLGNWQLDRYRGRTRSTSGSTRASGCLRCRCRRVRRPAGGAGTAGPAPGRGQGSGPGSPSPAGTTREHRPGPWPDGRQPGRLRGAHPAGARRRHRGAGGPGLGPAGARRRDRPAVGAGRAGRRRDGGRPGARDGERRRRGGPTRRAAGDPADRRAALARRAALPGLRRLPAARRADPGRRPGLQGGAGRAREQLAELRLRRAVVAVRRDGPLRLRLGGPPGGPPGRRTSAARRPRWTGPPSRRRPRPPDAARRLSRSMRPAWMARTASMVSASAADLSSR